MWHFLIIMEWLGWVEALWSKETLLHPWGAVERWSQTSQQGRNTSSCRARSAAQQQGEGGMDTLTNICGYRRNLPGSREDCYECGVPQMPLSWQQPCQQLALICCPACETLQVVKLPNAPFSSSHFELLNLYKSNCASKTWLFGVKAFRGTREEKNKVGWWGALWLGTQGFLARGLWKGRRAKRFTWGRQKASVSCSSARANRGILPQSRGTTEVIQKLSHMDDSWLLFLKCEI